MRDLLQSLKSFWPRRRQRRGSDMAMAMYLMRVGFSILSTRHMAMTSTGTMGYKVSILEDYLNNGHAERAHSVSRAQEEHH